MFKIKNLVCFALIITAFAVSSNPVYSQQTPKQIDPAKKFQSPQDIALAESNNPAKCIKGTEMACFDYSKIKYICGSVSQKTSGRDEVHRYRYQREVREAARVDKNDSREVVNEKIPKMLEAFDSVNAFSCVNNYLTVKPGSILKLAVVVNFGDFLSAFVSTWKFPVNRIDAKDGKTVLDFIDDEKIRYQKFPDEIKVLDGYYKRIREAGGKHAAELKKEKK